MIYILLILFFLVSNYLIHILMSLTYRLLIVGVITSLITGVISVYIFNFLGLTSYFLYLVIALAIFSWGTKLAIDTGEYSTRSNKNRMRNIGVLTSIVYISSFSIYFLYLYNL